MSEKKAKTHKGKLYLESIGPQIVEPPKECLFINTENTSELMRMVLSDLYMLRKDYSKKLTKKEKIINLEASKPDVEYLCRKNNCSLFAFSSDNKKHPLTLTLGSLFDHQVLDSFVFEVTNYLPISEFKANVAVSSSHKPLIIFQGELFEADYNYDRLRKFLISFFELYKTEATVLSELRRVIVVSVDNGEKIVKVRCYQVEGSVSKSNIDTVEFTEIGPSFDLKERKFVLADDEMYRKTLREPKELKEKREKNVEKNKLGEKRGRLHMQKQNLNSLSLKKYKKIMRKDRFGIKNEDIIANTVHKKAKNTALNIDENE